MGNTIDIEALSHCSGQGFLFLDKKYYNLGSVIGPF